MAESEERPILKSFEIDRLDLEASAERYTCSFPLELEALEVSIRRAGVLCPVTVMEREGRLLVVSGVRRVLAARKAGLERVPAVFSDDPALGDGRLFIRNLEENLASRALNLFERARAVARLAKGFGKVGGGAGLDGDAAVRREGLALLGLSGEERALEPWLALERLPEEVKRFLLRRGLAEKTALLFTRFGGGEALALGAAADRLRLTASQVREAAVFLREIAERDRESLEVVLADLEKTAAGDAGGADAAAAGSATDDWGSRARERFMEALRLRRLPDYTARKAEVEACLGPANAFPGIRVSAPPYLEGDGLEAVLSFRSPEELARQAETLERLARGELLKRAFYLLRQVGEEG